VFNCLMSQIDLLVRQKHSSKALRFTSERDLVQGSPWPLCLCGRRHCAAQVRALGEAAGATGTS